MSSNDEVTEGQVAMEAPTVFPPFLVHIILFFLLLHLGKCLIQS